MNALLLWRLEWQLMLADRRRLALGVLAPLALATVFVTGGLSPAAGSAACAALFVAYGFVSASASVMMDVRTGLAGRITSGGVLPASYLLQKAAASASASFIGLLPSVAVVVVSGDAPLAMAVVVAAALAVSLWIACVLGVLLGAPSDSGTELAVLGTVSVLVLLHMSAVFNTPSPDGLGALLEAGAPFRALHESLVAVLGGGGVNGGPAAAAWAVLLPALVGLLAPRVMARPARAS